MRVPSEEVLLNKLLNEMDGVREGAEVLFILTTNRLIRSNRRWLRGPVALTRQLNLRCPMKRAARS
jgi:SpoVK/Ycf46/Vps4 family AAA+-type ATPase